MSGEFDWLESPSWDLGSPGLASVDLPPADVSIGALPSSWDWRSVLGTVSSGVGSLATTIGQLQQQKLDIQNAREDRTFNQFMRTLSMDTQRSVATSASEIERIRAQTALAVEQRRLQGAQGAGVIQLLSGGGGGTILIMLSIAGIAYTWWSMRKKR